MKRFVSRLSYANVMATVAVFIALGGAGYAATQLPKNSVGTKQLKSGAVTGAKVKDGSLKKGDFAAGQIPAGPAGAPGPASFGGAIPAGSTLQGVYAVAFPMGATENSSVREAIDYGGRMASTLAYHYIATGSLPPAQCPGNATSPTAQPGNICFYESGSANINPTVPALENTPFGLSIQFASTADGQGGATGTWAATAP